jgi:hypothetical protein
LFFVVLFERVGIEKLLIRFSTIVRAGGRVCRAGDDNPVGRSPTRVHEAEIDRLFDADKRGLVFQIAQSIGVKGEFRQWEELLRVGV